jgi:hypothetical protein
MVGKKPAVVEKKRGLIDLLSRQRLELEAS